MALWRQSETGTHWVHVSYHLWSDHLDTGTITSTEKTEKLQMSISNCFMQDFNSTHLFTHFPLISCNFVRG